MAKKERKAPAPLPQQEAKPIVPASVLHVKENRELPDMYTHGDFTNRNFPGLVWRGGKWNQHSNMLIDCKGQAYMFTRCTAALVPAPDEQLPRVDLFKVQQANGPTWLVTKNDIYSKGASIHTADPYRRFSSYAEFLDEFYLVKYEAGKWEEGLEKKTILVAEV